MVYVCRGSDCRKHADKSVRELRRHCGQGVKIKTVRCQKVCKGTVMGAEVDGRVEWFKKMQKAPGIKALADFLGGGKLAKALRKRRSRKRSGQIR